MLPCITDVDLQVGQLLIDLPAALSKNRAKEIFWRIGLELSKSQDRDVANIGEAIQDRLKEEEGI